MGLVVRAVPVRVPLLPGGRRPSAATRSPSSASTPTTRPTPPRPSSSSYRCRIPSFSDPDQEIATLLERCASFPSTAFYDAERRARLRPTQGPYASEDELAADIERYALSTSADNRGRCARRMHLWSGSGCSPACWRCCRPRAGAQDSEHRALDRAQRRRSIPATEKWIGSALDDAAADEAPLAIIRLDTPGGLDTSMREIVQDIIDAPMPVVVYVSPDGARAASAGAFITEAADVAAMAPQTNIGSASAGLARPAATSTRSSARRSRTTPPPTSARSPSAHGRNGELADADGHRGRERDRRRRPSTRS